jgi:hypothetical protein
MWLPWLLPIGALLVLISLVSLAGVRVGFLLGSVFSAAIIALVLLSWGSYPLIDEASVVIVSIGTLVIDAVASRPARGLSEKDSPLNLPVFG